MTKQERLDAYASEPPAFRVRVKRRELAPARVAQVLADGVPPKRRAGKGGKFLRHYGRNF